MTAKITLTPSQAQLYSMIQLLSSVTRLTSPRNITIATARALAKKGLCTLYVGHAGGWRATRIIPQMPVEQRDGNYFRVGDIIRFATKWGGHKGVVKHVSEILPVNGPAGWAIEWEDCKTRARQVHDVRTAELTHWGWL